MQYYQLKSVLASSKQVFPLMRPSDSFMVAEPSTRTYIQPTFEKVIYETEKPTVILVSAVGATGKTALAQQLSRETQLPILDLGKHKPVGDNTLTGLLTSAHDVKDIGAILQGLANGSFGVIIDGLDEGRSKTIAKNFEAFLDDIVKLCRPSRTTTFVILGRTQVLDDSWTYLSAQGIPTALVTIEPFDTKAATRYIDAFTGGNTSPYGAQYEEARDFIIARLGSAFVAHPATEKEQFLAFIGYPPVLDAIVTLLREERNYHKLLNELRTHDARDVEVSLLKRIAQYILERERDLKVLPNIVRPLVDGAPPDISRPALTGTFLPEEQSARLVARCLHRSLTLASIADSTLNERYEEQIITWLPEHPFIQGHEFRNTVFEALAIATLITSQKGEFHTLAMEYVRTHKHSYHLIYMLDAISTDHRVPISHVSTVLSSAMEFRSVHALVELRVNGPDPDEEQEALCTTNALDIEVEIMLGNDQEHAKSFSFWAEITHECCLDLGSRLGGAFVTLPCDVALGGAHEVELGAPLEIRARSVQINAKALIIRPNSVKAGPQEVIIQAGRVLSKVESMSTSGIPVHLGVVDMRGLTYPLIQHAHKMAPAPADAHMRQKYFRLRRILLEFRSHSRGSLAKYRQKIEHERVLRNEVGKAVLAKLVRDGVLLLRGEFYHLDPAGLDRHLGITWHDLRKGQVPESLLGYLRSIAV